MASQMIYSTEFIDISADAEKKHVHIELSSSGYRPKYVSLFIENRAELERIIDALQSAKAHLA
ncbi:hypothetical protein [Cohnella silvisoli]|uniref:Uncharacterized protein n=1 Tax=Cohnella silvisoli TaxID=2873699 RepID=A0ABV1KMV5_9BACL|nr:hypothetical protein [Cohnella silvisoli]MCD9020876.1 hypothetical protein [Cohnella silvisoli]